MNKILVKKEKIHCDIELDILKLFYNTCPIHIVEEVIKTSFYEVYGYDLVNFFIEKNSNELKFISNKSFNSNDINSLLSTLYLNISLALTNYGIPIDNNTATHFNKKYIKTIKTSNHLSKILNYWIKHSKHNEYLLC